MTNRREETQEDSPIRGSDVSGIVPPGESKVKAALKSHLKP